MPQTRLSKQEIFDLICDKNESIQDLVNKIEIEDYINCYGGIKTHAIKRLVYGVNVRLNKDMDTLPFISTIIGKSMTFMGSSVAKKVDSGYTIPEFIKKFSLKEIYYTYNRTNSQPFAIVDVRYDDLLGVPKHRTRISGEKLKKYFDTSVLFDGETSKRVPHSFFSENLKELGLITSRKDIHVWVCGEDRDISGNSQSTSYLTNMMVITNDLKLLNSVRGKHEELLKFIMLLKSRRSYDADQERIKEATKAAKAAIMSRNMSHNLGSHVMSYLKQKLSSVTSIMKEESKVLDELIPQSIKNDLETYLKKLSEKTPITSEIIQEVTKNWEPAKIENVELPFLVGLGRFINYLQERQDYIATISTDYIPYGAPVNLKDAIYDELNPDLRYLRHKQERHNDARNKPANIMLNYIATSEGLSRENMQENFQSKNDIRIGFIDFSSNKYKIFGIASPDDKTQKAFDSKNAALTQMRKINFCLPGGLVGRQALFSIIENLIRNAAKHGDTSAVENLDFTLDVIDGSDIAWDVALKADNVNNEEPKVVGWETRIYDDQWRSLYEKASDLDDIYLLTITDNLPCNKDVVENLKRGLYELFVDPHNSQMTTANKGIKEIRISAAWIRGITDEECYLKYNDSDNRKNKLAPLVAVELSADNHLRYIICIRKNKTVAIVSKVNVGKDDNGNDVFVEFDEETLQLFEKLHRENKDRWNILTDEELKNSKTSYSFILCPNNRKAFTALRPFTSNRLCRWKINKTSNKCLTSKDSGDKTLMYIYRHFMGLGKGSEYMFIDDERAQNNNQKHYKNIIFVGESVPIKKRRKKGLYIYRTHHSTEHNYIAFYKSRNKYCLDYRDKDTYYGCVEGITGDNSSDRLVRREKLDEKWYYTHLYSFKKRVAIIDERIFRMVHKVDDKDFIGESDDAIRIEELRGKVDIDELKDIITDKICPSKELIKQIDNADSFDDIIKIYGDRLQRKYLDKLLVENRVDKSILGHSHLTPYYHGKQVDIFIIRDDAEGNMSLYGCVKTTFDSKKSTFQNTFEKLATFKYANGGGFVLEPVSKKYAKLFCGHYDYISIHQGILDKIYENLGIKSKDTDKCLLTKCIHECLMDDNATIGNYLPRFIIHSGRAKPTKEDMPQEQPFVQYAAIENAVKDCKPMLVELLDFAKYESNNN